MAVQKRRGAAFALAAVVVAGIATGCGGSNDKAADRPVEKVANGPAPSPPGPAPAAKSDTADIPDAAAAGAVERAAKWNLKPLDPAPTPPATKPVQGGGPKPPVIDKIPTDQKIVFVTIDDGAEKDPKFLEMMQDLRVPVSMFLNDTYVRQNPEYFRKLQALGASVQNHTLSHPDLKRLGADAQKHEICGNSDRIGDVYGKRPTLFRPPYGNWNATTQTVAGQCGGIGAIVKWQESMQINDMQYAGEKKLHPGDIILAHFRGPSELKGTTMTEMFGNMLRKIQAQGYTVARLEDYIG
ncbi:polysaccharide deacetylase family protein [Streptomyces sp. SID3343]|uniref:polysaccharide deacetylase family protein n=1 Tax=Streptomyces sp. SID3343 TaxID=2690260 RepID=UPI0019275B94|nr:polysaccharide deacetylase family protein [Streptomyces sp. SID3343]